MENKKLNFEWKEAEKALINVRTRGMPIISLNKHGYIRINNTFKIKNKLENKKYVEIRYVKKENSFILAFKFIDEKTKDSRKLYLEAHTKSFSFPLTSTLKIIGFDYKKLEKPINLNPEIQETEDTKIFVSEIDYNKS